MRLLLALLLLCACGPTPVEVCAHGEAVYRPLSAPPACPMVDRVARAGLALCPDALYESDDVSVTVLGAPFDCGGRKVHGCQDIDDIRVESNALIPDEYGHRIWELCYGRSGERAVNGRTLYDDDFENWLKSLKGQP